MAVEQSLRKILSDVLALGPRGQSLQHDTPLLGALPELDSMAIATLLTALEENFDILIEDDEISAETFASFGSLCDFITAKNVC